VEQQQDKNFDDVKGMSVNQDDDLLVSSSYYSAASAGAGDDFNRVVSDDPKPSLSSLIVHPRTAVAGLGLPSPNSVAR